MWGSVISAGASLLGGALAGRSQERAARRAARSIQYNPWEISSGLGGMSFDNGQASFQFSPESQAIYDQLGGMSQGFLSEAATFDPQLAAQQQYDRMAMMSADQEQQARLGLENRLFAQGRLGSTGGARQQQALETGLFQGQIAREMQSQLMGQQMQDSLFQRGLGALQGMQSLDSQAMQQLGMGASMGAQQAGLSVPIAQMQYQTGLNRSDAIAGLFGGIGNAFSNWRPGTPEV